MVKKNTFKSVLYAGAAVAALTLGAGATSVHADTVANTPNISTQASNTAA
ncbi:hypothetical protein [Pediococcus ethanolidurans]|nr:hypothetical protein [Pediococcus ethanolidurans]